MTDNQKEEGHYPSDCREKNYSHAWMHRYECARACVWSHSWGSEGLVKRLTALVLAVARVIAGGVCFWTNEVWETRSCLQGYVLSKSKNDDVEFFFFTGKQVSVQVENGRRRRTVKHRFVDWKPGQHISNRPLPHRRFCPWFSLR